MSITARAPKVVTRAGPMGLMAAIGVGLTVVTVNPVIRFAYDNLSLHVALETGEGLIAALLGYLAIERFRSSRLLRDVMLAWTFSLLAATNLLLSAVPIVSLGERPVGILTWAVVGMRLVGAAGLCAAAFVPLRAAPPARRSLALLALVSGAVLVVVALSSVAADAWLADALDPTVSPGSSGRFGIVAHPVVLGLQAVAMVVYAAAAVGFRRQADAVDDELLAWLAAGGVLAAFARLNFFLFPSLYSNWVSTGDLLRLGSYLCFLVGAARQIDAYRRHQTDAAVLDERRRVARELHDGVVQELAFIRSQTAAMAGGVELPGMAGHLAAAAERALVECRRAMDALIDVEGGSLAELLRRAADDVAARAGVSVVVHDGDVPTVPGRVRAALERVVREATTNAVSHGRGSLVAIELTVAGAVLRVTIADDGKGFRQCQATTGFGLRSMRERVEAIGGTLVVRSSPGSGTVVEATVPLAGRPNRRSSRR